MKKYLLTVHGVIDRKTEASTHPDHIIFNWRRSDYREPGIVEFGFFLPKSEAELNIGDTVAITISTFAGVAREPAAESREAVADMQSVQPVPQLSDEEIIEVIESLLLDNLFVDATSDALRKQIVDSGNRWVTSDVMAIIRAIERRLSAVGAKE